MITDAAIVDRLREAADRIDVDLALDHVLSTTSPAVDRRPAGWPRPMLAVACVVLLVGLAAALVLRPAGGAPPGTGSTWIPPITSPAGEPVPGAYAAFVSDPPGWLGALGPGRRTGALRTGAWVSTAFGRASAGGFTSPITVSAFDGTWRTLDDATTVQIDGHTYRSVTNGSWQALATTTHPTVVAHGSVDRRLLADVLGASHTVTNGSTFTVAVDSLPDGYVELVAPRVLAPDTELRRTLAESGGALAVNEVSDWRDPLLYAASTGADVTRHDSATWTVWSGTTTDNPDGPITFLVWAPRPGVLFEVDSVSRTRSVDDLIELAMRTAAIPADEWDALFAG